MPLLAVCYLKGVGGATTSALGLVAVAPRSARAVLAECDPAGGDLMRRHRLAATPSLVDLAAAARSATANVEALSTATQQLRLRTLAVEVVVAPAGGAQTRAALPELTRSRQAVLEPPDRLVVADCGRLDAGSPARPLLAMANVVLVLARARIDELAHVREHLGDLVDLVTGRLVVLLAPGGVYPAAEVADVLAAHVAQELARDPDAVRVWGPLPADRRAAAVLAGDLVAGRRWHRLPLLVALSHLLSELNPYLTTAGTGVQRSGVAR